MLMLRGYLGNGGGMLRQIDIQPQPERRNIDLTQHHPSVSHVMARLAPRARANTRSKIISSLKFIQTPLLIPRNQAWHPAAKGASDDRFRRNQSPVPPARRHDLS